MSAARKLESLPQIIRNGELGRIKRTVPLEDLDGPDLERAGRVLLSFLLEAGFMGYDGVRAFQECLLEHWNRVTSMGYSLRTLGRALRQLEQAGVIQRCNLPGEKLELVFCDIFWSMLENYCKNRRSISGHPTHAKRARSGSLGSGNSGSLVSSSNEHRAPDVIRSVDVVPDDSTRLAAEWA